eukprot:Skav222354  [mRNA]  locus=scaffold3497:195941:196348:+ [translate_table: standard]
MCISTRIQRGLVGTSLARPRDLDLGLAMACHGFPVFAQTPDVGETVVELFIAWIQENRRIDSSRGQPLGVVAYGRLWGV